MENPLKITFVYKTGIHSEFDGRKFKPQRKNAAGVHIEEGLCSHAGNEVGNLYLHSNHETRRVRGVTFPQVTR